MVVYDGLLNRLSSRTFGPLLVGIFYVALIVRGQGSHDGLVAALHGQPDVFGAFALRRNGFVDGERERVSRQEPETLLAAEYIEGAIYGNGHNGQLQLVGQLECTAAEDAHVACEGAGSFWEDKETGAAPQHAMSLFVGGLHSLRATLVNHDMAGAEAGSAHQRYAAEGLLHHPLEIAAQVTIDEEYVVGSLMVGNEDVGRVAVDLPVTADGDGQQHDATHEPAPYHGRIVAPEMGTAKCATDDGDQGCKNGGDQQQGNADHKLICAIQKFQSAV